MDIDPRLQLECLDCERSVVDDGAGGPHILAGAGAPPNRDFLLH